MPFRSAGQPRIPPPFPESTRLDLRSDPADVADELIAATSIVHGVPLLTRDARWLASRLVPLALRACEP